LASSNGNSKPGQLLEAPVRSLLGKVWVGTDFTHCCWHMNYFPSCSPGTKSHFTHVVLNLSDD
jgi:hypothetical protein